MKLNRLRPKVFINCTTTSYDPQGGELCGTIVTLLLSLKACTQLCCHYIRPHVHPFVFVWGKKLARLSTLAEDQPEKTQSVPGKSEMGSFFSTPDIFRNCA